MSILTKRLLNISKVVRIRRKAPHGTPQRAVEVFASDPDTYDDVVHIDAAQPTAYLGITLCAGYWHWRLFQRSPMRPRAVRTDSVAEALEYMHFGALRSSIGARKSTSHSSALHERSPFRFSAQSRCTTWCAVARGRKLSSSQARKSWLRSLKT